MAKSTKLEKMIEILNEKFTGIKAVPASEFYGKECDGIWFRGTESADIDGLPVFSDSVFPETMGVNKKLNSELEKNGWYAEPYDSGTLMAYEG